MPTRKWLAITMIAMSAWLLPAMGCEAAVPASTQTAGTQTVIRSHAELARYIELTPPDASPLSLLPPGARKRFLASLAWGAHGPGGFDTADLSQYLTDTQIRTVLALFDAQDYATGIYGRAEPLTASERHAPETPLERAFDMLQSARNDREQNGPTKFEGLYDKLLAPYQKTQALARLDDSDVGLLLRAAEQVAGTSHASRYLDHLRLDLATLYQRGLATPALVTRVHDQFVAAREFADANSLAAEYPAAHLGPLPPLRQSVDVHGGNPTVLVMEPDGKSMLHKTIDMHAPLRIVIVTGCHFSEDAARAIHADPELNKLFRDHATWLAGENESLSDVLQWNREFPDQTMHVAWYKDQWFMLDSWDIPTFYVFRDGKLVDRWSGWPADTGMQSLRAHLDKAGLLH